MTRALLFWLGRLRDRLPRALRRPGVLGIALTPAGATVLVRHSYRPGWFPPGGGRRFGETDRAATIRELGEEIGLTGWSAIDAVPHDEEGLAVFVVRDAVYAPRRSLEIEAVREFMPDDLPSDASPRLRRLLPGLLRDPATVTP